MAQNIPAPHPSAAREDLNEYIKVLPFILDDEDMLDIRFWKSTRNGPRPTKRGIAIKRKHIIKLIIGLQRLNAEESAADAYEDSLR